ncbi:MAG: metal-sensing transcriptional repressor [Candidatus Woykebacteria bacterium]
MRNETKKDVIKRLNITSGHVKKIAEMVNDNRYCIDVLQQTEAVKGSLKKIEEIILDSHLHTCVVPSFKGNESEKSVKEIVEIFKRR